MYVPRVLNYRQIPCSAHTCTSWVELFSQWKVPRFDTCSTLVCFCSSPYTVNLQQIRSSPGPRPRATFVNHVRVSHFLLFLQIVPIVKPGLTAACIPVLTLPPLTVPPGDDVAETIWGKEEEEGEEEKAEVEDIAPTPIVGPSCARCKVGRML